MKIDGLNAAIRILEDEIENVESTMCRIVEKGGKGSTLWEKEGDALFRLRKSVAELENQRDELEINDLRDEIVKLDENRNAINSRIMEADLRISELQYDIRERSDD